MKVGPFFTSSQHAAGGLMPSAPSTNLLQLCRSKRSKKATPSMVMLENCSLLFKSSDECEVKPGLTGNFVTAPINCTNNSQILQLPSTIKVVANF